MYIIYIIYVYMKFLSRISKLGLKCNVLNYLIRILPVKFMVLARMNYLLIINMPIHPRENILEVLLFYYI